MVTIKDVAKKAAVSIATVSCVINDKNTVKQETKEKVLRAIQELNYTPNFAGRMLKVKATKIIGAYVSDLQGQFYGDLLNGLKSHLVSQGYEFVVVSGSKKHQLIQQHIFDGIVVLDAHFKTTDLVKYADQNLPIVLLDRVIAHKNIHCLTLDNEKGIALSMAHLTAFGYRSIICLTGPADSYDSTARIHGALTYAHEHNVTLEMVQGSFEEQSGYAFAQKFMENFTEKKAILTFNDEMLLGIYNYYKEKNEPLENHMAIASFDNIQVLKYLNIPVASVAYSKYDWGYEAGVMLLDCITNDKEIKNKKIDVTLKTYPE